ncbi:MAG: hypothetical protein DMF88_23195 [Acidobacteria bacterium]|nr:MAG: hypothetical protein DMF88_23195 [Acidobacteriota bacterium]
MRKFGILTAAFAIISLAAPVFAHHGFDTEYDANKKVKLEGTVTQVTWTNPHMRVYIDVKDKDGKVTTWNMELTSPNTIRRQGWGPDDLKAGDVVIFEGFGGKVVENRGSLQTIMKKSDMKPLFGPGGPDAAVPVKQ